MGFLILPLIIGVIAVPAPTPSRDTLADFARIQKALNREVSLRDASGQERIVTILGTSTDTITVEVGRQWLTMPRDAVMNVDRMRDSNRDGVIKGVLIGLIVGGAIESAMPDSNGRYLLRGALSYGALGYMFDRGNVARQPLYRAP
jgi:uncharacterized protein YcfJ